MKHCGNCKRGAESPENPTCKECWDHEIETGEKFTKHENKNLTPVKY